MDSQKTANSNNNPFCGKTILVSYNGGPQIPVTVVDRCPECGTYDLDLSPAAFEACGAKKDQGRVKMTWCFA
jgi:expansin (peptidoglycan-binding protein)